MCRGRPCPKGGRLFLICTEVRCIRMALVIKKVGQGGSGGLHHGSAPSRCVTWDGPLHLSVPQFPHHNQGCREQMGQAGPDRQSPGKAPGAEEVSSEVGCARCCHQVVGEGKARESVRGPGQGPGAGHQMDREDRASQVRWTQV